jgi:hypothetical protein
MKSEAKTVDDYLEAIPGNRKDALTNLRNLCVETLDGYEESMEYGMPSYKKPNEDVEVAFASQKQYISLYILKEEVLNRHRGKLSGLNLGKGCIRYRKPEQIDFAIVREILADSHQSESEIC